MPTPTEDLIGEITWTWLCLGTFIKATVFGFLSFWIINMHRDVGVPPSRVAGTLMWFFSSLAIFSSSLTAILIVVLLNDLETINYLVPFPIRVLVRIISAIALLGCVIHGVLVVLAIRSEARIRANGGLDRVADAAERTADATERIAAQGDVLNKENTAGRSAAATERIADTGDRMTGNSGT